MDKNKSFMMNFLTKNIHIIVPILALAIAGGVYYWNFKGTADNSETGYFKKSKDFFAKSYTSKTTPTEKIEISQETFDVLSKNMEKRPDLGDNSYVVKPNVYLALKTKS